MLINKLDPNEKVDEFLKINFTNFQNELDINNKTNLGTKKVKLFDGLIKLSLLNVIKAKDNEKEFIKQFREKYGIN